MNILNFINTKRNNRCEMEKYSSITNHNTKVADAVE